MVVQALANPSKRLQILGVEIRDNEIKNLSGHIMKSGLIVGHLSDIVVCATEFDKSSTSDDVDAMSQLLRS
jgi:hypothetical protein